MWNDSLAQRRANAHASEMNMNDADLIRTVDEEEDQFEHMPLQGEYAAEHFWGIFAKVRQGKYPAVEALIKSGYPIDAREPGTGNTILMIAAGNRPPRDTIMKLALRRGSRLHAMNNKGWNAMHHCIANENLSQLEYLNSFSVARGHMLRLNEGDVEGVCPLHLAVEQRSLEALCRLIEIGVDINVADKQGRGVMHRCAVVGDIKTAETLRRFGADINMGDVHGRCPAEYASRHDQWVFLEWIEKLGGEQTLSDIQKMEEHKRELNDLQQNSSKFSTGYSELSKINSEPSKFSGKYGQSGGGAGSGKENNRQPNKFTSNGHYSTSTISRRKGY